MSPELPPGRNLPAPQSGGPPAVLAYEVPPPKSLGDYVALARRNAWLIGLCGLAGLLLAGWLVSRDRPEYRATATIRLTDERRSVVGGLGGDAVEEVMGNGSDEILSHIQVLQSREIATAVAERADARLVAGPGPLARSDLRAVEIGADAPADTIRLEFGEEQVVARASRAGTARAAYGAPVVLDGLGFVVPRRPDGDDEQRLYLTTPRSAVERVRANTSALRRDRTNVVDVGYVAHDPVTAQRIADALVEEFQRHSQTVAQQQSRRRRLFIEEQLAETEALLESAQEALSAFRRREGVYSSRELFAAQQAGMLQIDVRREELAADRGMLTALLDRLESSGARTGELEAVLASPVLASSPVVTQLFGQLSEQQARLDSLRAVGAATTNPDVRRYEGLVASTREKLANAAASHLAALEARIAALDGLKARQRAEIRSMPGVEAEEARLAQQVQTLAGAAELLQGELQKARIAEAVEGGQVQIVDRAPLPLEPVGSGRTRKLVFGLMLGLMVGGGIAVLRDNLNTTIRARSDLEDSLHLTGLAVIPQLEEAGARGRLAALAGRKGNGTRGGELVVANGQRSAAAEAYRTLRTNLHFSSFGGSIKRIVITSPSPDEGKTTTAANLAAAFAQQGRSVVLVDGDLRKGRLHRLFDVEREPGLVQLLMDDATLEDVLHATDVPGLSVITTGKQPPNPAELLGARMEAVMARLGERFDLIVVDSPPVLAAADVSVLATVVDGVILVVKAGNTERGAAQAAMEQLRQVNARMLGAVLNDPDAKVPRYGGGYYRYAYYGDQD